MLRTNSQLCHRCCLVCVVLQRNELDYLMICDMYLRTAKAWRAAGIAASATQAVTGAVAVLAEFLRKYHGVTTTERLAEVYETLSGRSKVRATSTCVHTLTTAVPSSGDGVVDVGGTRDSGMAQ